MGFISWFLCTLGSLTSSQIPYRVTASPVAWYLQLKSTDTVIWDARFANTTTAL